MTETRTSKTWKVVVGCGNLYVTVEFNEDGSIHKIRIPRNTKFKCSLMMRDRLAKQSTFQARQNVKQLVKDLKGSMDDTCEEYNIMVKSAMKTGKLAAYSCQDAVARVVEGILRNVQDKQSNKPGRK